MLQTSIMFIQGYAYRESNGWWKILVDSISLLSQDIDIGICHDVNISELRAMFDV